MRAAAPTQEPGNKTASNKPVLPEPLKSFSRELRQNQTDTEKALWQVLRARRIGGAKFRRQHPPGSCVLDFYCHELKLVIEFKGGQHNPKPGRAHGERRSVFLARSGITVQRSWNNDVFQQTEAVVEAIFDAVSTPSPLASLPWGEGDK